MMMDQGYICNTAIRLMDVLETMLPVEHAERTARMERGRIRNNQKFEMQTDYPPAAVLRVERGICASLPEVRKLLETSEEHAETMQRAQMQGRKVAEAGMKAGVGCLLFLPRLIPNLLAMLFGKVHHEHLDWSAPLRFNGPTGPVAHVYGDKEAKAYFSHLDALLAHADTLAKTISEDSGKAGTLAGELRQVAEGRADFAGAFVGVCGAWADAVVTRELATEFVRSDAMAAAVRRIFLPV